MTLLRLLALCSIFALSACDTTSWNMSDADTQAGPRKIPCASITNPAPDYSHETFQHREQLEIQPTPMC